MLESLASLFAPWAGFYADHTRLSTAITYSHIAALLWGGGRAVTADLLTLRSRGLNEFQAEGHLKFLKGSVSRSAVTARPPPHSRAAMCE